ncbi:MAG: glycosyltransferase family 9 protein [Acidiferrobacterales bacterium]
MAKPKLIFKGPVTTASGYGVHSRQLLKAVLAADAFDVSVHPINWGQTPFILEPDPFMDTVKLLAIKREMEQQSNTQYDLSVQVTIPNEFEKIARVNIGVTAGIETDRVSPVWLQKTNDVVDLLVVPSMHSAQSFGNPKYSDGKGNNLQLQKPILLAPEGVDTRFFNTDVADPKLTEKFRFETPFNFLSVGLGFDKGFGEDRKNFSTLVKWFIERFQGDPNVGLVLKVSMVGNSLLDFETVKNRISEIRRSTGIQGPLPHIYLIHGRLSDQDLSALYKHPQIKAYVSLTHGEGFGLPMIEAAACGLPIVATNWSGHLDFLKVGEKRRFVPVDFDLAPIPKSCVWNGVMEEGSMWANPREEDAKNKLKKVVLSYEKPLEWANELAAHVKENFALEKVSFAFAQRLVEFYNNQGGGGHSLNQSLPQVAARIKAELNEPGKTLLYTMPMSAGDVYISTAVVNGLKKKFPEHKIFFATEQKYTDILKNNPDIHKVIPYQQWMQNVPLCELVFDEVYTPNLAIQTTAANWVRGGKGRLLGNEMAAQCQVEFGDYFIELQPTTMAPDEFVAFHPGSGKGQWEARNYRKWQEVVNNIAKLTKLPVVQLGTTEDPLYENVVDLRGQTNYNKLAFVISKAKCLVGIDSVSMHMAAGLGTPHVAIFGSSYSTSTGPVQTKKALSVLIDTKDRYTCEKACYKYECSVDKEHPCINEIPPREIVKRVIHCLEISEVIPKMEETYSQAYEEHHPKIVGYTTILNGVEGGYPFQQSVESMLGFCDLVVVVDGGSKDGTLEVLKEIGAKADGKLVVMEHAWDWEEPGMDGLQKAFARAMCQAGPTDFLWQQDADEVVHEEDYAKIKKLVERFPAGTDLIHLPVVELWGPNGKVRTDRHSWKWRLSRNNFRITHGSYKDARIVDEKTGKTFAKKGQSDGCEYIDIMTQDLVPHKGFYSRELELLRIRDPQAYGREMNRIFGELPSVFHYSWADLPRKIHNFKKFWNKCWSNLYNDPAPVDRFPDVETEEQITAKAIQLLEQGGEHGPAQTFDLQRTQPASMR